MPRAQSRRMLSIGAHLGLTHGDCGWTVVERNVDKGVTSGGIHYEGVYVVKNHRTGIENEEPIDLVHAAIRDGWLR